MHARGRELSSRSASPSTRAADCHTESLNPLLSSLVPPSSGSKIKALISPLRAQGGPLVARVGKPRDEFASTGGVTRGG